MADTKLQQLVINVGTKEQIEAAIAGGTITEDMLSVTTDGDTSIQGVKVNGTELTPDGDAKVNIDLTDYEVKATIQTLSATDSITLADNTIYNGGEQTALTIALPATVDVSFLCEIDFTSGTTPATLAYPNTIKWLGDDVANNVFIPVASKRYTVIVAYDGVNYRATVKGVA